MRNRAVMATLAAVVVVLSGCGSQQDPAPAPEESSEPAPASETAESAPRTLPGAEADDPNGSPEPEPSGTGESSAGDPFGSSEPSPGPDDVAGHGVVAPSPSPAVEGDGRSFGGFMDLSTVDRSSAEEVAIEAMRALTVWDTTEDTVPGDASGRVDDLVTAEALERGASGPGNWAPMWWRQAQAAGAWSSAQTELVPSMDHVSPREGAEWVTVEVSWSWHAPEEEVVPEGGTRTCTVAVEEVDGQQTVTAFDCVEQKSPAGAEE